MPAADTRPSGSRRASARSELERARECVARRAWGEAFELLGRADEGSGLEREDLERLATVAYLIGRDDDYLKALERAHRAHAAAGEAARAARSAFWLGLRLMFRGDAAQARGWFARAQRVLDNCGGEQVEQGYLLLPVVEQQLAAGELDAAHDTAQRAIEIGERFGDADLVAIARHQQGHVCLQQGRTERGLLLFDETMVSVIAGELSPVVTGLVYCGVIDGCRLVYAFDRSREWTAALARWCDEQPEMVAFTGVCQVHRSEIMQLHGAWPDAALAAQRAGERCRGINEAATSEACYQQGEVHRLRGELAAAEQAYRDASRSGMDPQPGLALLRLAQGRTEAAVAAIRRAATATRERWPRTRLLPAYVEIMLAARDLPTARAACGELAELAASLDAPVLGALAAHARGSVELADGDPRAALGSLRRAWSLWHKVDAPYPAARARELMGLCCRALEDEDGARLELEAAGIAFAQLGAAPDLARVEALLRGTRVPERPCGLTSRELQVLRLIAAGKTNKAIAAELFLSEKTVERHISNLFGKLDVSSRAAATAYAYEHGLL